MIPLITHTPRLLLIAASRPCSPPGHQVAQRVLLRNGFGPGEAAGAGQRYERAVEPVA